MESITKKCLPFIFSKLLIDKKLKTEEEFSNFLKNSEHKEYFLSTIISYDILLYENPNLLKEFKDIM